MDQTTSTPTTINQLSKETFQMILDYLTLEEKLECRLVSKYVMTAASYIFKKVKFTKRVQVTLFAETIVKNPSIADYVEIIYVGNAAMIRAISQTKIKEMCHQVKEVDILEDQGAGNWAKHLLTYRKLQHLPALMDDTNAKIILDKFKEQMISLRLGGKYLNNMTRDTMVQVINSTPLIETFGLRYLYKGKNLEIHRDLPHTWTFNDLNQILNQLPNMHRFELQYCEIADESLIGASGEDAELVAQLQQLGANRVLLESSLLDVNQNITHIEMDQVQVKHVTPFVRSILDSYVNLESLDVTFVERNKELESAVGSCWDLPHTEAWTREFGHHSKLKKLALTATQERLSVPLMLKALGKAQAPLQELYIVDTTDSEEEDTTMDIIRQSFSTTLKRLTIDNKAEYNLDRLKSLFSLEFGSFHWVSTENGQFVEPHKVLENCPQMTELCIGYTDSYNSMNLQPLTLTNNHIFINVTNISLSGILINENVLKTLLLPLTRLKEAVFIKCLFENENARGETEGVEEEGKDEITTALDRTENFGFLPSSSDIEDKVRKELFGGKPINEIASLVAAERRGSPTNDPSSSNAMAPTATAVTEDKGNDAFTASLKD